MMGSNFLKAANSMEIKISNQLVGEVDTDCLIIPVFEGDTAESGHLAALNRATDGLVDSLMASGEVIGKRDHSILIHRTGAARTRRLLFYGAGRKESINALSLQRLGGAAVRKLASYPLSSLAFYLRSPLDSAESVKPLLEGALLGVERGNLYQSNDDNPPVASRLTLVCPSDNTAALDRAAGDARIFAEAANFARRLGFEPGNEMTPTRLAERAAEMCEREGLGVEIFDEGQMKEMGMGALLAVSRGSEEPARLIAMKYEPQGVGIAPVEGSPLIALVGKGITFDSGGISIKPAQAMEEMKYDMGGGAAVIGAMQIIAQMKPNVRVLGLVAASENLPSGRAYKPGDVVRSYSGKTIEIINTDAEGRVVLADALTYAVNQGATQIVDAATLTGACVVALGETRAGVMGTDQELIDALIRAGEQCGERLWGLPLESDYGGMIKSDIADVKNSGGRVAGSITAAMFLKSFVASVPWAHLDIAGTAWFENEKPYIAKGATGFGARLLATYVLNQSDRATDA